jgi:hypothetical protein
MLTTMTSGKHRRETVFTDKTPTEATCRCHDARSSCPRHEPVYYSEYMAAHATDSLHPSDCDPWRSR